MAVGSLTLPWLLHFCFNKKPVIWALITSHTFFCKEIEWIYFAFIPKDQYTSLKNTLILSVMTTTDIIYLLDQISETGRSVLLKNGGPVLSSTSPICLPLPG